MPRGSGRERIDDAHLLVPTVGFSGRGSGSGLNIEPRVITLNDGIIPKKKNVRNCTQWASDKIQHERCLDWLTDLGRSNLGKDTGSKALDQGDRRLEWHGDLTAGSRLVRDDAQCFSRTDRPF